MPRDAVVATMRVRGLDVDGMLGVSWEEAAGTVIRWVDLGGSEESDGCTELRMRCHKVNVKAHEFKIL